MRAVFASLLNFLVEQPSSRYVKKVTERPQAQMRYGLGLGFEFLRFARPHYPLLSQGHGWPAATITQSGLTERISRNSTVLT